MIAYKRTILKVEAFAQASPLGGTLTQLVEAFSRELDISVDDFAVAIKVPASAKDAVTARRGWRWSAYGYAQVRYGRLRARFGAAILPRGQFTEWVHGSQAFRALHRAYVDSGLSLELRPVVVRIDDGAAWVSSNMRWITFSERKRAESDLLSGRYKERKLPRRERVHLLGLPPRTAQSPDTGAVFRYGGCSSGRALPKRPRAAL
jgi:hypothetical protein